MKKAKIKELDISQIKPYWRNMNKSTNVELVKKSIENYGYNSYIKVDKNNIIVAGHSRYKALNLLGYTKIKVIVLDGFDDNTIKMLRLLDNGISNKNTINFSNLESEIKELIEKGGDEIKADFEEFNSLDLSFINNTSEDFEGVNPVETEEQTESFSIKGKEIKIMCPECYTEFTSII